MTAVNPGAIAAPVAPGFDLDGAWTIHPAVSVRPEPFGALLYHFGNRKLSFLKTRQLLEIVQALGNAPTARAACLGAGATESDLPALTKALASLQAGETIIRRQPEGGGE
jgi:putative mycofactocin binding protein MftB